MAELSFRPDPAYQKVAAMTKNRVQYFRFTPRTARITFIYVAVIPALVGYLAYQTDGLYNLKAKRKGDTVYQK
ncbi:unnamed protein product [Clonostachys rhizophaga]|uniref:Uncharacterized protein n=1 Tax=Clonostachys rhizophaga TaxID=160324 RepID=A0A9N9V8S9_9HYPO|nr:unnamed protein product [Clonostachys rhizophaga]